MRRHGRRAAGAAVAMHRSAVAMHRSAVAMHRSAVAMHRSAVAMHRSAVAMHRSAVMADGIWVADASGVTAMNGVQALLDEGGGHARHGLLALAITAPRRFAAGLQVCTVYWVVLPERGIRRLSHGRQKAHVCGSTDARSRVRVLWTRGSAAQQQRPADQQRSDAGTRAPEAGDSSEQLGN